MKNRIFLQVMLVMVLAFAMAVVGCDDGTTESDAWSNVTSLNQMNGTWKGSYSVSNRPIKDFMEEQGQTWNDSIQEYLGDIRVTIRADITTTINASAKTQAMSMSETVTFSGGNINTMWSMIKQAMGGSAEGVTVNDANHSITMKSSYPAETLSDDGIARILNSGLQINQNGTKIKAPANAMGEGSPELIFSKQ